ncbi:MAG: hypothetical protein IH840_16700, partial [Candidatus Heimdallarchaeota archaeon]|nr:hypothetical protein [Candidatus Heimdallarchaeota archaeon]
MQNDISIESGHCDFCLNSLSALEPIIKSLLNKLPHIDFETYLIGVQIHKKLRKLEESYIEQGFTPLALKETVSKFVSTKVRQKLDQRV